MYKLKSNYFAVAFGLTKLIAAVPGRSNSHQVIKLSRIS